MNETTWMGTPVPVTLAELPEVVIADQHGHFWRKYGDMLSMCPVSTENVETHTVATYVRSDVLGKSHIEAALGLLVQHDIHGGLPNGYCAVCEGHCLKEVNK